MYQIIRTWAHYGKGFTKSTSRRQFQTYDEAERFVMALVNDNIKHYTGDDYLPIYEIKETI